MDPVVNPYAPGAGSRPPALVGRDEQIDNMSVALRRLLLGSNARSQILTGLRGVGKTVMLVEFQELAEAHGYFHAHIEVTEDGNLAPDLAAALRRVLLAMDAKRRAGETLRRRVRRPEGVQPPDPRRHRAEHRRRRHLGSGRLGQSRGRPRRALRRTRHGGPGPRDRHPADRRRAALRGPGDPRVADHRAAPLLAARAARRGGGRRAAHPGGHDRAGQGVRGATVHVPDHRVAQRGAGRRGAAAAGRRRGGHLDGRGAHRDPGRHPLLSRTSSSSSASRRGTWRMAPTGSRGTTSVGASPRPGRARRRVLQGAGRGLDPGRASVHARHGPDRARARSAPPRWRRCSAGSPRRSRPCARACSSRSLCYVPERGRIDFTVPMFRDYMLRIGTPGPRPA